MKKLVFIDFDGTIYDNKNKVILETTKEAIKNLANNPEIILGIATGRSIETLDIIEDLLPLFYIKVLINGAFVQLRQKTIYKNPISKTTLNEILPFLDREKISYGLITKNLSIISNLNDEVIDGLNEFGLEIPSYFSSMTNLDVYQLWVFGAKERNLEFQNLFPDLKFVNWHFNGMDVLNNDASKADGIKNACKYIDYDEMYVFGDGLNDIEMFKLSKYSVAMGQASDELKKHSTYVTDSIDKDGLVKGLKYYNLI